MTREGTPACLSVRYCFEVMSSSRSSPSTNGRSRLACRRTLRKRQRKIICNVCFLCSSIFSKKHLREIDNKTVKILFRGCKEHENMEFRKTLYQTAVAF